MAVFQGVQNDYGYTLTFKLRKVDGLTPYDLTNSTVKFRAKYDTTGGAAIVRDCVIGSPATSGICAYTIQNGDFPLAGTYNIELTIGNSGHTKELTVTCVSINILPRTTA